jgi:uncharacterized protein (DUF2141 family)
VGRTLHRQEHPEKKLKVNSFSFPIFKYLMISLTLLFALSPVARAENWNRMVLNIKGIEAERGGQIHVFVFLEDGFPIKHEKAQKSYVKPVKKEVLSLSIEAPANVPFALKVHHDEDGNNMVTKNWTGIIPAEGLGFSAGAKMNFGPPSFAKAKINIPMGKAASINMQYP